MSDTSQATPPAQTESGSQTQTETAKPAETSSTTTKPAETTESKETSLLNTEAKPAEKTEAKPEAGKEGEKKPEDKKAEGAPEKYADFTVPEGYELDKGVAENASAIFKKHGLSQAAAQELVDFYSKHAIESSNLAVQSVKDMRAGWVDQVRTSEEFRSEFGADGKIKPDSKVLVGIGRMLDSLGDAKLAGEFRQAMDLTGAGDHPAFFRVMAKLANHFAEGSAVAGKGPSPHGQSASGQASRRSPAEEIYPNLANRG